MTAEVESMFYSEDRTIPWKAVGKSLDGLKTSQEMLKESGLDWLVEQVQMYAESPVTTVSSWGTGLEPMTAEVPEPRRILVPNRYAHIRDRDGAVLGDSGARYHLFQNWEGFQFMDDVIGGAGAMYESAGMFNDGRVTFISAVWPESMMIGGEDPVEKYLILANSFDSSTKLTVMRSNVRVVCRNTLNLAMKTSPAIWGIAHTRSMKDRLEEVRRTLELSSKYDTEFEQTMNRLMNEDFHKGDFEKLVRNLWPSKARNDGDAQRQMAAMGVFESSTTVTDGWRYTKYGALQAVSEYVDWIKPTRTTKGRSHAEQQADAVWFGANLKEKTKALNYLLAS